MVLVLLYGMEWNEVPWGDAWTQWKMHRVQKYTSLILRDWFVGLRNELSSLWNKLIVQQVDCHTFLIERRQTFHSTSNYYILSAISSHYLLLFISYLDLFIFWIDFFFPSKVLTFAGFRAGRVIWQTELVFFCKEETQGGNHLARGKLRVTGGKEGLEQSSWFNTLAPGPAHYNWSPQGIKILNLVECSHRLYFYFSSQYFLLLGRVSTSGRDTGMRLSS